MEATDNVQASVNVDVLELRRRRWSQIGLTLSILAAVIVFVGIYYARSSRVFAERESYDIAQIARNIKEGRGFTTRFIRPFNAGLVEFKAGALPEANHAPAMPYAMAMLFKLRGSGDDAAAQISLLFLVLLIPATYLLGSALFDPRTGMLAAALVGISAPMLETALTGQEWTLAALLFVLMLLGVAKHHGSATQLAGTAWTAFIAVMVGALYLTNHLMIFLLIPLTVYFAVTGIHRRAHLAVFLVAAALICAPWIYRNAVITNSPLLGANAWDIMVQTKTFPGDTFLRSTDPDERDLARAILFPLEHFSSFAQKLMERSSELLRELPAVLGLVGLAFAAVSILYRFKAPTANAVRGLVYGVMPLFVVLFALFGIGPRALILFVPIVAVFGSGYFFLLLGAKKLHPIFEHAVIGAVVLVTAWPALSGIVWKAGGVPGGMTNTDIFFSGLVGVKRHIYCDQPWLVAWRTDGTGVWLPMTESDISALDAKGFPIYEVTLTNASSDYAPNEVWYMVYKYEFWRSYMQDPKSKECTDAIAAATAITIRQKGGNPKEIEGNVERFVREQWRRLAVSQALDGFRVVNVSHFSQPNDIVILTSPEM